MRKIKINTIKIKRTGNIFSFASTEYEVEYPDGHTGKIWSPPWHEMNDEEEDAKALEVAIDWFNKGIHKKGTEK